MTDHHSKKQRNSAIARAILSGCAVSQFAKDYGISTVRSYQIVRKYCQSQNCAVYSSLVCAASINVKLKQLRENADAFLYEIEPVLTLRSSIYKVRVLPMRLRNALIAEGIETIEALLNADFSTFHSIPHIGEGSLDRIKAYMAEYAYLKE
jgi:hypothetical protein